MTIDDATDAVHFAYPQIYYACHTRHLRRRSGTDGVSDRDAQILVHLDRRRPTPLAELARHMDLAKSTLSEALTTLEELGHVSKTPRPAMGVVLTERGVNAVRASSVLDAERLRAALSRLTPRQRAAAARGLSALANARRGVAVRVDR